MDEEQEFTQCFLRRKISKEVYEYMTSFIPKDFAVVGNFLELKGESGAWTNGWKVISKGITLSASNLLIYRDVHKLTRKASDL